MVLRDGFYAKAWERDPFSEARINSDDETSRRELYASVVQDLGLKLRTRDAPIATCAASPAIPPMHPWRRSLATSGAWIRVPSRFRRSSVRSRDGAQKDGRHA